MHILWLLLVLIFGAGHGHAVLPGHHLPGVHANDSVGEMPGD